MFQVGDSIVYPMYGAGQISRIEEKEVLGELHSYYCVYIPHSKMDVMIPVDNSDAIGVRPVIDGSCIDGVLGTLGGESEAMPSNWNKRFREYRDRLKTGDIHVVAGVVRDLVRNDRSRKLSAGEKKLLLNAKQILGSELAAAGGFSDQEADDIIMSHIT